MKNVDVVRAFVMGEDSVKTKNLKISGDNLINYNTVIAKRERIGGNVKKILVNSTKYSATTTRITSQLKRETPESILEEYVG